MKIESIKFKAKRLDGKGCAIGDLLHSYENGAIIVPIEGGGVFSVDPSTVCQFTGLKDCDGKEIWEGDIIENPEFPFEKRTVTWFDCVLGFVPMDEDEHQDRDVSFLVLFKKWKVVGNKLDRKEGEK